MTMMIWNIIFKQSMREKIQTNQCLTGHLERSCIAMIASISPKITKSSRITLNWNINQELGNLLSVTCVTLKPRKPIFGSTTSKQFFVVLFVEINFILFRGIKAWRNMVIILGRNILRLIPGWCVVMTEFQILAASKISKSLVLSESTESSDSSD